MGGLANYALADTSIIAGQLFQLACLVVCMLTRCDADRVGDAVITSSAWRDPSQEGLNALDHRHVMTVSYTHLTLPTTPYV